jgi:hypothetical protein
LAATSGGREEIQQHQFLVLACLLAGHLKVVCPWDGMRLDSAHEEILLLPDIGEAEHLFWQDITIAMWRTPGE